MIYSKLNYFIFNYITICFFYCYSHFKFGIFKQIKYLYEF